jgi:hypothetical protein
LEEVVDELNDTLNEYIEIAITDIVRRGNNDVITLGTIDCSRTWIDVDTMFWCQPYSRITLEETGQPEVSYHVPRVWSLHAMLRCASNGSLVDLSCTNSI